MNSLQRSVCAAGIGLAIGFLVAIFILCLAGCSNLASHVPNSIPVVGSNIAIGQAFTQSAEGHNQAIKPHADATGKVLVDAVSSDHSKVLTALTAAGKQLDQVQTQRDTLVKDNTNLSAQNARLLHSWGYRFQVFVTRAFWVLVALAVLHATLASAAFLLPLFFPAAAVAVPFLSLGAKIINPFGWFTVLAGHAQTRYLMNAAAKPGVN